MNIFQLTCKCCQFLSKIFFSYVFYLILIFLVFFNRILVDTKSTPNNKTKVSTLKFLTELAKKFCTAAQFPTMPPADKAITKIVTYTNDQKCVELRSQARTCVVALYNCNTPNVSFLFSCFFLLTLFFFFLIFR